MSRVLVVGFGKFGQPALPKIRRRWPKAGIWIIDRDPGNLTSGPEIAGVRVLQDGAAFLWEHRKRLDPGDWIIPAVPFHLAGDWLRRALVRYRPIRKIQPPRWLGAGLPFSLVQQKDLYLSLADFKCPENCPAPKGTCFRTGEKRPRTLAAVLADRPIDRGTLRLLHSRQLAPGLGGFRFAELQQLEHWAQSVKSPVYLATICTCHGVVTGFSW